MKTKNQTQKTIVEEVLKSLKTQKIKIQAVDSLVAIATMISLIWAIIDHPTSIVAILVGVYATIYWWWIREDLFDIYSTKKSLQLLELAVKKTGKKIYLETGYFSLESQIMLYIRDITSDKENQSTLYARLEDIIVDLSIEISNKNEGVLLYNSPSLESLMSLFFEEIATTPQSEREKYLENIQKLMRFFSRF